MTKHNYSDFDDSFGATAKARNKKEEKRKYKAWDQDDLESEWYDQIDDCDDYSIK